MLTLAANLSTLFPEHPFEERFALAADLGFRVVEVQFPYALAPERLQRLLQDHGLELALLNAPAGDLQRGERGLVLEGGERFEHAIGLAARYAAAIGCPRVHLLLGNIEGRRLDLEVISRRVGRAARTLAKSGAKLMLEPLNTIDEPDYFLRTMEQAHGIRLCAGEANIGLQFDAYHAARSGADVLQLFARHADEIGHIQIADPADRGEPTGPIMQRFLQHLEKRGWGGPIGCEYRPRGDTLEGLGWAREHGIGGVASAGLSDS